MSTEYFLLQDVYEQSVKKVKYILNVSETLLDMFDMSNVRDKKKRKH